MKSALRTTGSPRRCFGRVPQSVKKVSKRRRSSNHHVLKCPITSHATRPQATVRTCQDSSETVVATGDQLGRCCTGCEISPPNHRFTPKVLREGASICKESVEAPKIIKSPCTQMPDNFACHKTSSDGKNLSRSFRNRGSNWRSVSGDAAQAVKSALRTTGSPRKCFGRVPQSVKKVSKRRRSSNHHGLKCPITSHATRPQATVRTCPDPSETVVATRDQSRAMLHRL